VVFLCYNKDKGESNMDSIRILVAEDEKDLNAMICDYLQAMGFETLSAYNGKEALDIFLEQKPDLLVLDIMMPVVDGLDVTRSIRERSTVPIILLTAKAEEGDKLLGLEIGADDYITKPFSLKELAARIRVIMRRVQPVQAAGGEILSLHGLELDQEKRTVKKEGQLLNLTAVQFDILHKLMDSPGRVFKRLDLLGAFQEDPWEGYERTMDVHIKNLRKLIENDPSHPRLIETVWGVGYRFREGEDAG